MSSPNSEIEEESPAEVSGVELSDVAKGNKEFSGNPLTPSTSANDSDVIAKFGRYEILGRLAVGGMAEIFLAEEKLSGASRKIVLKLVKPQLDGSDESEQMFLREGRIAMNIHHANICPIYDFGKVGDQFYIAMEWVDGITVRKLLGRAGTLRRRISPHIAAYIASRTAAALHAAHRTKAENGDLLGIVHRDVSPQNIMVSYEGGVKLLDFGVAKSQQISDELTQSLTIKGKFAYMSPEQCLAKPADARSDVFALGICLYEMLTSRRLYKRGSMFESSSAIIDGPVPSLLDVDDSLPESLNSILAKALAKDPGARFQSAGDFDRALREFLVSEQKVVTDEDMHALVADLFKDEIAAGPKLHTDIGDRLRAVSESIAEPKASLVRKPAPPVSLAEEEPLSSADGVLIATKEIPWKVIGLAALLLVVFLGIAFWPSDESIPTVSNAPRRIDAKAEAAGGAESTAKETTEEVAAAKDTQEVVKPDNASAIKAPKEPRNTRRSARKSTRASRMQKSSRMHKMTRVRFVADPGF